MKGKGTENIAHYEHTTLHHLDMGNIHAIRDSHTKLCVLCAGPDIGGRWSSRLEQTGWLAHVWGLVSRGQLVRICFTDKAIYLMQFLESLSHCYRFLNISASLGNLSP